MNADAPKGGRSNGPQKNANGGDVFDIDRIRQIVELMEQHELNEVDLQQADDRIKLTRGAQTVMAPVAAAPAPAAPVPVAPASGGPASAGPASAAPANDTAGTITINSPMVGTFYSKANPESPAFVSVGDVINEDTIVCIVEAMKVFNEIPAECRGKVVEVLAQDQQAVDFGKPLFRIQVDG